jgi:hypothetical protein
VFNLDVTLSIKNNFKMWKPFHNETQNSMVRNLVFVFLCAVISSGCIEIEEKIMVHADRSGSVSYAVKTSGMGSALLGLSDLIGFSVDLSVLEEAEEFIEVLKTQPGIHNLNYNLSHSNGLYFLQFDFADASSFNKALYRMVGQKKTIFSPGYLKICPSRFRKLNFSPYLADYLEKEVKEFNMLLNSNLLNFTSEISFPREIKRTNKKGEAVMPNQTTISQTFKVKDILEEKTDTGLKVRY